MWVGQGRGRATIDPFFDHQLSDYQKSQIHTGCCDMSEAYMGAISSHCPNAQLVLDRFHIVKALNDAIDDVRKEQWREASAADRKALKGLRWLLYRHSSTRSRRDTQTLRALERNTTGESIVRGDSKTSSNNCGPSTPRGRHCDLQAMDDLCLT